MTTLLADLVRRQTSVSLVNVFSRTVDKAAEEMALDLLRDPEIRDQLRQLVKAAFDAALKDLQNEKPPEETPDIRAHLRHLDREVNALRMKITPSPPGTE